MLRLPPSPRPAWQAELFGHPTAGPAEPALPPRRAPLSTAIYIPPSCRPSLAAGAASRTAALFTAVETSPAAAAHHADWPAAAVYTRVVAAFKSRGIGQLYRHQAEAPVASAIPWLTRGPMRGAMSIVPITTAELFSTRPRLAIPMETARWI